MQVARRTFSIPHAKPVIANRALVATMRKPGAPGAKERPIIAPSRLVNLSLYSRNYEDFMVTGWPDNLDYPADAQSLQPDNSSEPMKMWYPYQILKAFYIGTKSGAATTC